MLSNIKLNKTGEVMFSGMIFNLSTSGTRRATVRQHEHIPFQELCILMDVTYTQQKKLRTILKK